MVAFHPMGRKCTFGVTNVYFFDGFRLRVKGNQRGVILPERLKMQILSYNLYLLWSSSASYAKSTWWPEVHN